MVARRSPVPLALLILIVLLGGAVAAPRASQAMSSREGIEQPHVVLPAGEGTHSVGLLDPAGAPHPARAPVAGAGYDLPRGATPPLWALAFLVLGVVLLARPRAVRSRF